MEDFKCKVFAEGSSKEINVGLDASIIISDFGSLEMLPDEQVTFISNEGKEYDVAKSWVITQPHPLINV